MRMDNSFHAGQQKPLVTPELRQAITILTMAAPDLIRYIENAVLENPMLEIDEEIDTVEETPCKPDREDFTLDWCTLLAECGQIDCSLDRSWTQPEDPFQFSTEHCLAQAPTLHEYLTLQLHLAQPGSPAREIAGYLIGCIDDRGYLQGDPKDARNVCDCTVQAIAQALRLVQSFDPPGVGGRNLGECLLLQLERRGLRNALMEKLVSYFLDDLPDRKLARFARALGLTAEEVSARYDLIRSLDPCPGCSFSRPGDPRYIIPDVVVEKVGDEFLVLANDLSVPRLVINRTYQALLTERGACNLHDTRFLESKLRAAVRLIHSIEQRRATLHRVVQLIVECQEEFLNKGLDCLKPLNLKNIARVAGLHESTVSRTIANKHVQTPRGVFSLKVFFGGVEGVGRTPAKGRKH